MLQPTPALSFRCTGTGWPSFFDALPGAVALEPDYSIPFMPRVEVRCSGCGARSRPKVLFGARGTLAGGWGLAGVG